MKPTLSLHWTRWAALTGALAATLAIFAQPRAAQIEIQSKTLFPESITSTKDGTLIIGSSGEGAVYRIPAGKKAPELFIASGTNGLSATVLGVLADEASNTLWLCSQAGTPTLMAFDLKTAAHKGSYPLPGTPAACNDIAVRRDGNAYIGETSGGSVMMLKKGGTAVEVAIKDPLLAGADGLAFLDDQNVLYVNSVTASKLLRVTLGPDGKGTSVTELKLSKPIQGPDGMRQLDGKRILLAENTGGKMDIVTFPSATEATIETILDGLAGTPAVTYTQGKAWIVEGKFNMRAKGGKGGAPAPGPAPDPSPFRMWAVDVK
jgi:sugar lactone lactonase YvrE